MAKVDKSQYNKEQAAAVMAARRAEKQSKIKTPALENPNSYTILCLKHGTKYSATYVNTLYNMCKRNCTLDFDFVCLTDDPKGIDSNIKILGLPDYLSGWWCKPYIFSNELDLSGTILYMDLDVVLSGNIDKLFAYQPGHWCTIKDFTRVMRSNWKKYNSSIIRFTPGQLDFVWENFKKDRIAIQRKFFGDQDYLYDITANKKAAMLYPDSWIQSWKWEVRKSKELQPGKKGFRKLKYVEDVVPRIECCVCVFHGDPNPEHCEDPWVIDNWK